MNASSDKPLAVMPAVLVIEDNEPYRTLLEQVLQTAGFEVCTAPDGRRVASILAERPIDLVITDVSMPERDGLEIMTELRTTHPRLPVIAISGDVPLNRELYLTLADKLGAARVLAKPFKLTDLIAAAREAVLGVSSSHPRLSL